MTDLHSGVNGAVPDTNPDVHVFVPDSLADLPADAPAPEGDAETITVSVPAEGAPADAPDVPVTLSWADLTSTTTTGRAPIIPLWWADRASRRATLRAIGGNLRYWTLFHGVRTPKYLAKTAVYAPRGAWRAGARVLRWASAEDGNWSLRQHAASVNDAHTFQSLDRMRAKSAKARWWVLIPSALGAALGLTALESAGVVPGFGWYCAEAAAIALAARAGRPADKPITDRISSAPRFIKLTAEMVRNALLALNLPGMKDAGGIEFVHPGVHRDGPGWLARVNLPHGLEAVKVLERRGGLSSSLRLPVDQVWPSAGPEHAGQVDLWVGYQPASKMGQPKWSLAAPDARTSAFEPYEFASDERQRPVMCAPFGRSWLLAGQPGSGKTFAERAVATGAVLDPTAEMKVAEFKGTGDFLDLEPLCSTYVVGVDEAAFDAGAAILRYGLAEAERRGKRILAAKKRGEAPLGKVTPELSSRPGSGLHPLWLIFDEVHELFAARPDAAQDAERLAKRARALNIYLVLATQIPDRTSLPPNLVRCITNRWCLSVAGQVENDMILGTGAYKRGITGTVYRPVVDAGWGCLTGLATPVSARSQFPDPKVWAAIVARGLALRNGKAVGGTDDLPAARDLLADLLAVAASNGQHWDTASTVLAERWPQAYPALTQDALRELAQARGLSTRDVKVSGSNRKGYKIAELKALIAETIDGPDRDDDGAAGVPVA
jgi:S-DNA-T family DNA segregation ATPase FtsK/SpoIIIE